MRSASKEYIINTVFRTNILPLTSECNTACMFCSHRQNPEGIEVFRLGKLGISDFEEIIEFLSPDRKIIIGESATRIVEGEPLLHKDFINIVSLIRKKYRDTPIQITTNGILLTGELVNRLVDIGNIELNVSVNCIDEAKRKRILGLASGGDIKEKLFLLKDRLTFSASAVVVPGILEEPDIEEMTAFLDEVGAVLIRLFMAGYTDRTLRSFDFEAEYNKVKSVAEKLGRNYEIPVILEPSFIKDLECRVEGVIKGTPSHKCGIKSGDVITAVNGSSIRTRVEGFNLIHKQKNPKVEIRRGTGSFETTLLKEKNSSPGFVVLYDIDPEVNSDMERLAARYKAENVFVITSELAFRTIENLMGMGRFSFGYKVIKAENKFFGGSIKCAGLLTVNDVVSAAKNEMEKGRKPDLVILPPAMFDSKGRDILGKSIKEAEKELNVSVDTI